MMKLVKLLSVIAVTMSFSAMADHHAPATTDVNTDAAAATTTDKTTKVAKVKKMKAKKIKHETPKTTEAPTTTEGVTAPTGH